MNIKEITATIMCILFNSLRTNVQPTSNIIPINATAILPIACTIAIVTIGIGNYRKWLAIKLYEAANPAPTRTIPTMHCMPNAGYIEYFVLVASCQVHVIIYLWYTVDAAPHTNNKPNMVKLVRRKKELTIRLDKCIVLAVHAICVCVIEKR